MGAAATLIVCLATVGVRIGPALLQALTGPSHATPLDRTMTLTRGEWVVFELTGSQTSGGPVTVTNVSGVTLTPGDVVVTDPTGRPVATSVPSTNQTINRNGTIYSGAVAFDVTHPGKYRIRIAQAGDEVLIGRDIGSLLGSVLGFIVTGGSAGLGIVAGVVVLVVSARRRRRRLAQVLPAPGWYADPRTPGAYAWWNGQRWEPTVPPSHPASPR